MKVPAGEELKVWLRYSSIVFMDYVDPSSPDDREVLTYELNIFETQSATKDQKTVSTKPGRDIFQIYVSEIQDLKYASMNITCDGRDAGDRLTQINS